MPAAPPRIKALAFRVLLVLLAATVALAGAHPRQAALLTAPHAISLPVPEPIAEGIALFRWAKARDAAVGEAGLLVHQGRNLTPGDWSAEKLGDSFVTSRHPRTMIGVDAAGVIWLVTVDGRPGNVLHRALQ